MLLVTVRNHSSVFLLLPFLSLFNVLHFSNCFIALGRRRKWGGGPPVNAAKLRHKLANHKDF